MFSTIDFAKIWTSFLQWADQVVFNQDVLIQVAISALLATANFFIAKKINRHLKIVIAKTQKKRWYRIVLENIYNLAYPIYALILFSIYVAISKAAELPSNIPDAITSLIVAWIIISLATSLLERGYLVKWIKLFVIFAVGLDLFGLLDDTILLLDSFAVNLGETKISLYTVTKGIVLFIILIWITFSATDVIERGINKSAELTPSLKVLFSKFVKITLFTITGLISLKAIGLDLTAFTVFTGAVGVGVGFGLQKVISNFLSGIILLSDRSIKPGDVIAIGNTYGWVNALGARYVSVITRDGKEHLIPNESLITEKVENWSFSNNDVRLRIPIGVSYNADLKHAMQLVVDAAKETPRVLQYPKPRCLITEFGDSTINLELRLWINDPVNGMGNIKSEVLLHIWEKFQEHKIEIPYPQREIHIRSNHTKFDIKEYEPV